MKVVFQYLKPFAFILLLCVLLLFGQALSDLSLPNLMSDIVNIGLQKNGIDEPVPEQISEQGMELICLFMKEEEREAFQNVYEKQDGVYILSSAQSLQKAQEAYGQSALTLLNLVKAYAAQGGQSPADGDLSRHRQRGAVSAAALLAQCAATDGRGSVSCSFANR